MPNRGPVNLTLPECAALLAELPPPADPRDAEDAEERQRIKVLGAVRARLTEQEESLAAAAEGATGAVVLSIDEVDEVLDCMPPPPMLGSTRQKLSQARENMLSGAITGAGSAGSAAEAAAPPPPPPPPPPASAAAAQPPRIVPVTVITGYLGAGKTTVIRSLLGALPPNYTCAWLKNEYGDAAVDSAVAADARISVREVTNGCLCCTKVGELGDALTALWEMRPDRILVEASGSALPGPLVWEVQKLKHMLSVDGVVTVVDCENFERISDFTRSARVQAECTDLVLLNKVELAGERKVDDTLDDLHELVPDVPKVRTVGPRGEADPALVFGLDSALWSAMSSASSREEAEALSRPAGAAASGPGDEHMAQDSECYHVLPAAVPAEWTASRASLQALLASAPTDDLYRTKGVVPLAAHDAAEELARLADAGAAPPGVAAAPGWWLYNGVAGRLTLEPLPRCAGPTSLVFMGRDLRRRVKAMAAALGLPAAAVRDANAMMPGPRIRGADKRAAGEGLSEGVARGLCLPCDTHTTHVTARAS